ncbi:GGDEF domain-containing protein [Neobacillus sp. D3-1R]|uniref:GGDEF domain-containing protein n=1 Tax=Neobacillus sp. D3-1R TaxID=3445778 RepID=UPI003F9F819F
MNFLLDMKTIFITLVAGHLFTVILISAYWRNHKRDSSLNTFFLAKSVEALAWLLLTLKGGIPDISTISISNTLLFLGVSLETIAIMLVMKSFTSFIKKIYMILTTSNILGFHLILLFINEENIRICFASFGTAAFILIPAYQLMKKKPSSLLMKIMGSLYFLAIISFILRGSAAIISTNSIGLFTPGFIQTISFFTLYLVMFLGNTGFILLLKERADEELIQMAYYDELTSTLNRRIFISTAKNYLLECEKEQKPLSFVLFDIDNFKKYNDKYGHEVGDRILQDFSKRINSFLDPKYLFGRYGGDEFAMLLTGLDSRATYDYLEKVRELIAEAVILGVPESYTISIGYLTIIPNKNSQLETLYISCDKALYNAKNNGHNCVYNGQYESKEEMVMKY